MCKVSVIIYVKNSVAYIEQCIQSVRKQTLKDLEIIVSDGGSADGTIEIIDKLRTEDSRIRFLQGASGVGAQFNQGLRAAIGRYIGICEADDYVRPEMYEQLYELAEINKCDVVKSGYYKTFSRDGKQQYLPAPDMITSIERDQVVCSNDGKRFLECWIWHVWSGIYRKEFLLDNGIFMNETDGASHQDITFQFLVQLYAKRLYVTDEHYYCYRLDNPQASMNGASSIEKHAKEYDLLMEELKRRDLWDDYKEYFMRWEYDSYRLFYKLMVNRIDKADHIASILREQALREGLELSDDYIPSIINDAEETDKAIEYFNKREFLYIQPVVFGMGHLGSLISEYLESQGVTPVCIDNDKNKQSTGYRGRMIHDIDTVAKEYKDHPYIVANTRYAEQMLQQLLSRGILRTNIYVCNDEDIFVRRVCVDE